MPSGAVVASNKCKYPRISLIVQQEPATQQTKISKRILDKSKAELRRLNSAELVKLLSEIVGYQPNVPKESKKA